MPALRCADSVVTFKNLLADWALETWAYTSADSIGRWFRLQMLELVGIERRFIVFGRIGGASWTS